jgi:monooxygenase
VRASWSSSEARWKVDVERGPDGEKSSFTCGFLFMCSGYYDYAAGYTPEFLGRERFKGRIVHPQKWTGDIHYAGKRVVVIGSGATAVTLIPEMAKTAANVTMLQRSPSYVVSLPEKDRIANALRALLPARVAHGITRWKNVLFGMLFFKLSRSKPDGMKKWIVGRVRKELGPDYDVEKHFTPYYNPWDQRMCLVPNGDLFASIRDGRVSVVTDHIETFTERGLKLQSGAELEADLIVTATGLNVQLFGGMQVKVDGERVDLAATMSYKGMMFSDVPNLASAFGYTNASWTLKCDLTCEYVCRLLNHMDTNGYRSCTPRRSDPSIAPVPWMDFSSGYVQRAIDRLPKQGSKAPWRLYQNYALDVLSLRFGSVTDEAIEFAAAAAATTVTR